MHKKASMPTHELNSDHITNADISEIILSFSKDDTKELHIRARKKIIDIDLSMIGYFFLFNEDKPDCSITLDLPYNTPVNDGDEDRRIEFKLKQWGTYGYILTGKNVFTLILGKEV